MHYFSADLHLNHRNIINYCDRPFSSVQEMNETLLNNINSLIQTNDTFWILGDFAFYKKPKELEYYRNQILCKNVNLICGSHDPHLSNKPHPILFELFQEVANLYTLKLQHKGKNKMIILCHYAMRTWNKSHFGSYSLFGHSHGRLPDDISSLSFDCGVDCHNFVPLSLDDVINIMSKKKPTHIIKDCYHQK